MSDMEKNINEEEVDELGEIVYTLTDEETGDELEDVSEAGDIILTLEDETGEVYEFLKRDEAVIDGQRYFALEPLDDHFDDEEGIYLILRVVGEGDNISFENLDEDEEERIAEYFDDRFFNEADYDA